MNVAIWGAGKFGQYVFSQLETNHNVHISYFIDSGVCEGAENVCMGIPVVSPITYAEKYAIDTNLVLVAFVGSIAILDQLKSLGIERFGFVSRRVYSYKLPLCETLEEDPNIIYNDDDVFQRAYLDTLETNVVDCCNLNCKGCSHFSNLFSKGSRIPLETFEKDIEWLSTKVSILQFNLLGGEALLSDQLTDYIACLKKYMPKTNIELVSNGLLIPHQKKEVWECIRDNDVTVSITEYPPTTAVLQRIKDTLQDYGIPYSIRPLVKSFGKNIDLSGKNIPAISMANCRESRCQFLRAGKLYKCPFAALGNYFFEYYEIPICLDEGIDIYDPALDWKAEMRKLCQEPIAACKYCGKEESFPWARSDNPLKEEWLV